MSKAVSDGQALNLTASFAVDTNWGELDGEVLQQLIELPPKERGVRWTAFLKNGARLMLGALILLINRAKKFNPAVFIGAGWTVWFGPKDGMGLEGEEAQDAHSLALTQIDWSKVKFETCLRPGETSITGEEKLARLKKFGATLLDAGIGEALWLDYQSNKENSVLEKLRVIRSIEYLDFFGTILRRRSGGRRCVLCLYWFDGAWRWYVYWLGSGWRDDSPSAVLAS